MQPSADYSGFFLYDIRSDGLWDVISTKKAVQLVVEVKDLTTVFSCHCSAAAVVFIVACLHISQCAGKGEELW